MNADLLCRVDTRESQRPLSAQLLDKEERVMLEVGQLGGMWVIGCDYRTHLVLMEVAPREVSAYPEAKFAHQLCISLSNSSI